MHNIRWLFLVSLTALAIVFAGTAVGFADVHIVQKGEYLSLIGKKYGVAWKEIQKANGLRSTVIRPGQKLTIPDKGGLTSRQPKIQQMPALSKSQSVSSTRTTSLDPVVRDAVRKRYPNGVYGIKTLNVAPLNSRFSGSWDWQQLQEVHRWTDQERDEYHQAINDLETAKREGKARLVFVQPEYDEQGNVIARWATFSFRGKNGRYTSVENSGPDWKPAYEGDPGEPTWQITASTGRVAEFVWECGNAGDLLKQEPVEPIVRIPRRDEPVRDYPPATVPPTREEVEKRAAKLRAMFGAGVYHKPWDKENEGYYSWVFASYQPFFLKVSEKYGMQVAIGLYISYLMGAGKDGDFSYWWNSTVTGIIATLYGPGWDADIRAGFGYLQNKGEMVIKDFALFTEQFDRIIELAAHVNWYQRDGKTWFPKIEGDVNLRLPIGSPERTNVVNGKKEQGEVTNEQKVTASLSIWIFQFFTSQEMTAKVYTGTDVGLGHNWGTGNNFMFVGPSIMLTIQGYREWVEVLKLTPIQLNYEFGVGFQLEHSFWIQINGLVEWFRRVMIRPATPEELALKSELKEMRKNSRYDDGRYIKSIQRLNGNANVGGPAMPFHGSSGVKTHYPDEYSNAQNSPNPDTVDGYNDGRYEKSRSKLPLL